MTISPAVDLYHIDSSKFAPLKQVSDPVIDIQSQMRLSFFKNSCFCGNKERDKDVFFMCKCKNMAHKSCMPWRVNDFGEFECSACTILSNDPLNQVVEVLLEPSIMHSCFTYKFKLKLQDFNSLNSDSNLDIEIRCIKMDGEHFFEQTWPDKAEIRLNGSLIKNVLPLMHNSSLKKRRDEKLTFCPIIGTNTISFNFENIRDGKNTKVDKDPFYTFTVVLVKKLSVNDLADKIIRENTIGRAESVKLIKEKFQGSGDINISEVKADLDCKLSLSSLVHPARGKYCTHLNCFSLKYFLKSMQSNTARNWSCPICKKPCYKLIVDSYLETIIADTRRIDPSRGEVFFRKDGSVSLTRDTEMQAELLSTGGSSKLGTKHTQSKHLDKISEPIVVVVEDDEAKQEASSNLKPVTNYTLQTAFAQSESKNSFDFTNDFQAIGKRQPISTSSFLDDKEFLGYLHNYTRKSPRDLSDESGDPKSRPGFSSFETALKKRFKEDWIARHLFQVFYGIVMKKKKESEVAREKAPIKGLYQDFLSEINAIESTEKSMTSTHTTTLDVLQWVLRDYKLDYQNMAYQNDKLTLDSERTSLHFT